MVEYLDCLSVAGEIIDHTKTVRDLAMKPGNPAPKLAVVEIDAGDDDRVFLRGIKKTAAQAGIEVVVGDVSGDENGILLLGSEDYTWNSELDIDSISDGCPYDRRCVTEAALTLINKNGGLGKKIVTVIGRGAIGMDLTRSLVKTTATVCICHSKTPRDALSNLISVSDIVICASRGARFGTGALKDGALVIDIGNGFSVSEIDEMEPRKIRITPRKNGIGCITRAIIMNRVVTNYLGAEFSDAT